jgi:hypothetical protein
LDDFIIPDGLEDNPIRTNNCSQYDVH